MNTETRLFLGASCAKGVDVGDKEFAIFLREVVEPWFASFSVFEGSGFWQGDHEQVRVLVIFHDREIALRQITMIAGAYKERFAQESVLIVSSSVAGRLV